MARYRRARTPGACYFFTVVAHHRRAFLTDSDVRTALRQAIIKVRARHPFAIDAWVLLPDHLHCIWTLPEQDADYPLRWNLIKRYVTRSCRERLHREDESSPSRRRRREATLWQRRYWEHRIRDERDFSAHMDYVHYNPVKHGLCVRPVDWPYSSLHRWIEAGVYPADWAAASAPEIPPGLRTGE